MKINKKIIDKLFMLVEKSGKTEDFPVAAIIFKNDKIISCGYNKKNKSKRTFDHAEIIAIEKANKKTKNWNLQNTCMVVTLEPCDMCKAVIKESRIDEVYYIVPRLSTKKQYNCTTFLELDFTNEKKDIYLQKLKEFYVSKR